MITISEIKDFLKGYNGKKIRIMEVCGTHTSSIFKNGIRSLISPNIELISGPGCPVCVTSAGYIDKLIEYSLMENTVVLTYGDMMKVKGSEFSLTDAKAQGGNIKVIYSPQLALKMISQNSNVQYIMAAVGFETTVPIYALMLDEAIEKGIKNLKLLTSLKTIIPALEFVCENEKGIDAFLCPGHVSVILGYNSYEQLANKYKKPFVVAGFEGEHILIALFEIIKQIQNGQAKHKNMYPSVVTKDGNEKAKTIIEQYFEQTNEFWRGIGSISGSGLKLREKYNEFDAGSTIFETEQKIIKGCKCSDVILGRINPVECPLFKKVCTPLNPIGPCMVSIEGACGIWYKNNNLN